MKPSLVEIWYPIVDALGFELKYTERTGHITGAGLVEHGFGMTTRVTAVCSYLNKTVGRAGVVFHGGGDLYFLVCVEKSLQSVGFVIFDASDLEVVPNRAIKDFRNPKMRASTMWNRIKSGVVKLYAYILADEEWIHATNTVEFQRRFFGSRRIANKT